MIIDCHTHIECLTAETDTISHQEHCQQADAVFVLASAIGTSPQANEKVSAYIKTNSKMIGFATFNPLADKVNVESVASVVDKGNFKGIVLYCSEKGFHPCHSRAIRLYEAAAELGLPVFFHNSAPYSQDAVMQFADPVLIDEIARDFPDLNIIIGAMAEPFIEKTIALIAKHNNVFGDLTVRVDKPWQTYNRIRRAFEAEIMDKLIFGSGYPCGNIQASVETLLGFNKMLPDVSLPNVPREKIREIIERDVFELFSIKTEAQ